MRGGTTHTGSPFAERGFRGAGSLGASRVDTGAHRDGGGGGGEGQRRLGVSLSLCSHIVLDEALRQGLNACSVLFSWVPSSYVRCRPLAAPFFASHPLATSSLATPSSLLPLANRPSSLHPLVSRPCHFFLWLAVPVNSSSG